MDMHAGQPQRREERKPLRTPINLGRCSQPEQELLGSTPQNSWARAHGWKGICRFCLMLFLMLLRIVFLPLFFF